MLYRKLAVFVALGSPGAQAQAGIDPDRYETGDAEPLAQSKTIARGQVGKIRCGVISQLPSRVRCNGSYLPPGKYLISVDSQGRTVRVALNRGHPRASVEGIAGDKIGIAGRMRRYSTQKGRHQEESGFHWETSSGWSDDCPRCAFDLVGPDERRNRPAGNRRRGSTDSWTRGIAMMPRLSLQHSPRTPTLPIGAGKAGADDRKLKSAWLFMRSKPDAQPSPQKRMSCTTSAHFGSPRGRLSR
jgi:hypothetical protein